MANFADWINQDLQEPARPEHRGGLAFTGDNRSVLVGVHVTDGGAPADLSGSVVAHVVRSADGGTVTFNGLLDGSDVSAVLPEACFAYPGRIAVMLQLVDGTVKTTLCRAVYDVVDGETGTSIDPGSVVPDLSDILAMLDEMEQATEAANAAAEAVPAIIAPTFDTSTAYTAGSYVYYDGALYRFTTDHAAGAWTGSDAVSVQLAPEVSELKSALRSELSVANAFDVLPFLDHYDFEMRGVAYAWNSAENAFAVNGTATGGNSVFSFYANVSALPYGMAAGRTYRIKYSSANVYFQVLGYNSSGAIIAELARTKTDASFTIPAAVIGMVIRLFVENGTTVSETVSPILLTDVLTNAELSDNTKALLPAYKAEGKYVAFGDSLSWGAVWSPTQGAALHRVKEEWRIPTRIALAVGKIGAYENAAVGGMGYIAKIADKSIVDTIKTYDLSGVDLITVMGGPNDYAASLGTAEESTADDGTICGAVLEIIGHVKANYPKCQIVFVQSTPFGPGPYVWNYRSDGGWSLDDFEREISKICAARQAGYVSWRGCTYLDSWKAINVGWNVDVGPNWSHPITDSDYALLGDYIAGRIAGAVYGGREEDPDALNRELRLNDSVACSVLGSTTLSLLWEKHAYIDATYGDVVRSATAEASVTPLIQIPDGSVAVISAYSAITRYATYDENGDMLHVYDNQTSVSIAISSADAAYFRMQFLSLDDAALHSVSAEFRYADRLARMSDLDGKTGFSNQNGSATGNPIVLDGAADGGLLTLSVSGSASGEVLAVCGKNLFHFQHPENLGMVQNGVTFHYNMSTQAMSIDSAGATGVAISANANFTGCTTLDGVAAYHNFHFRFKVDTPIAISPNYSYDPYYDDKIQLQLIWIESGTLRYLPVGYEGTAVIAKAGVEYGIRVYVSAGFAGSVSLRPQIEIGTDCTALEPYRGCEAALPLSSGAANLFALAQNRLIYSPSAAVRAEFHCGAGDLKATANAPAAATLIYNPDYDGKVNGKDAYYLCKFTPGAGPVCVSGVPEALAGLITIQIVDGTNIIYISGTKPYVFTAEANKEYGYRLLVLAGAIFEYTFQPVVATGAEAIKLFGTSSPITSAYTSGSAALTAAYSRETRPKLAITAGDIARNVEILTAGKIAHPFGRLKGVKPTISIIDDDTTSPTLIKLFHDILAGEGVVGNYAVEMRNVDNYSETMPGQLLEYEEEGFGMLYHCYKQDGDADRYWESGNEMYDESLIRQNFYRGLRAYKNTGFNSARYWVTPYGVNDEFIRGLAKEADMECLLSCPTSTYACNASLNFGANFYRYNLPRWIFLSGSDNDWQGRVMIDGCAENGLWLIIVTHVNSWPSNMVAQNTERLQALIQYAKAAGCQVKNFIEAYQTFKPLLGLNEMF